MTAWAARMIGCALHRCTREKSFDWQGMPFQKKYWLVFLIGE
jgi:hypothetical protein